MPDTNWLVRFAMVLREALIRVVIAALFVCLSGMDANATGEEPAPADNPFARSELEAGSDEVTEGDTVAYTLTVRASGLESPQSITATFLLPGPALLASSPAAMAFDEDDRELNWEGEIRPGEEKVFRIEVVTLPNSSSNGILLADAAVYWRPAGREWEAESHWLQAETRIRSRSAPVLFVLSSGMAIGKVELVLVAYLVLGSLLIVLIPLLITTRAPRRKPTDPGQGDDASAPGRIYLFALSFFFVVGLGVAHLMVSTAWQDARRFVSYEKGSCTLLDKRLLVSRSTSQSSSGANGPARARPGTTTEFKDPVVAVRYRVGDTDIVTSGSPRPTAMLSPLDRYALRQLDRYERGESYPCWYDPQDPKTFVLARGLSLGWYLLGIGPLVMLYFVSRSLWRRFRA